MKSSDTLCTCSLNLKTTTCECTDAVHKDDVALTHCPHCGESYYKENYGITTCVYYPPIYKDGVNINPDRNATSVNCTCMNCNKEFCITR